MSLALARESAAIRVRPSGDATPPGGEAGMHWFWPLLILGIGGFVAYDYAKGNITLTKNPESDRERSSLELLVKAEMGDSSPVYAGHYGSPFASRMPNDQVRSLVSKGYARVSHRGEVTITSLGLRAWKNETA